MIRRPRGWKEKGFTLLEIMLAVGIGVVFMGERRFFFLRLEGTRIWRRQGLNWKRRQERLGNLRWGQGELNE